MASNTSRTVVYDTAYGPFGELYATSGSYVPAFTGPTQHTASNVYDFPAREYGIQGRWPSPDPAGVAAVNPMDPQTWNRYAYVRNNPLSMVDPFGLDDVPLSKVIQSDTTCGLACWPNPFELSFTPGAGFEMSMFGNITFGPNPFSGGGGGGGSSNSQSPQAPISCSTVLPNGQTVGNVVQQQQAVLQNATLPVTNIDNLPIIYRLATFASIASPGGSIDFKNNFKGQANANFLASAGNFAYYAIGSSYFSTFALDAGAGTYGLLTATFGSRPFSDLTGPMLSDSSAAGVRNAALASNGCRQ